MWSVSAGSGGYWRSVLWTKLPLTIARVAQMSAFVTPSSTSPLSVLWVKHNLDLVSEAVVLLVGVSADGVQVDAVELPSRRLQSQTETSSAEFELRIMVTDDTNASAVDLAEETVCSLFGCAGKHVAFHAPSVHPSGVTYVEVTMGNESDAIWQRTSLQEVLDPLSPGLWNGSTLAVQRVMIVDEFTVAVASWIEGPWGSCSARCGSGVSRRNVSCSFGIPAPCAARTPGLIESPCENYDACFTELCALFRLEERVCTDTSIVVVVCGAVVLCCCGCLRFALWRFCRRSRRCFRVWIDVLQCHATCSLVNKPYEIEGSTGTRTHHVWEYDQSRLDAFLTHNKRSTKQDDLPAPRDESEVTSEGCATSTRKESSECAVDADVCLDVCAVGFSRSESVEAGRSSSESEEDLWTPSLAPTGGGSSGRHFRWVWKSTAPSGGASASDTIEPLPMWVKAAHEDGSIVEYYSCHNDQWFLAVVSLAALHTEPLGPESFVAVVYNVVIGRTKQQRTDVDLRLLRRPLGLNESVEVRTLPSGVWQAARILKATQSDLGRAYKVTLDGEGGKSLLVPATSLRRRFAAGSTVSAYLGTTDGWVSGALQDASPSDQRDCPSTAVSLMPLVRVTRNCCGEDRSLAPVEDAGSWNVDQREFSVSCGGRYERVPAYFMDSVGRSCSGEEGTILV